MNTNAVFTILLAGTASIASASFVHQSDFSVTLSDPTGIHGIASDGSNFYLGSFQSGVSMRDSLFNETALYGIPGGAGEIRGLSYDASSGTLLAGNYDTGEVYRMSTAGTLLNTMNLLTPAGQMNAVGADGNSGNIFTLSFSGLVQQHTSAGAFLSSFNTGINLTGLAVDDVNQSIFIMTSSTDEIREYDYSGNLIGTVIAAGTTTGNGQGLHYDNTSGELYVTSQFGDIAVWADSTRQTVPTPASIAILGLSGLVTTRRRRNS